ncbi:hypothetical protein PSECIP111951_00731 [Pseudoalteromonas holothuriae]|uniref:Copper chaperone n=1 Tax=Pseudoalteromonas holothuriae TaxID=2963714 RepID=A0A9W4QWM5_9GAMM|nr:MULTISPECIES: copper chaperone PCu(A)C [unclassified Pseudoalteromonas]CAH9052995.1 hypothetical protein PSECIP111951_00731 [Pseudoalteromonas sp. CIP111951]CAH9056535.1 hypothetical protein PSECIP111854_01812 [Pseudoalteromonas sp. CIP111854]
MFLKYLGAFAVVLVVSIPYLARAEQEGAHQHNESDLQLSDAYIRQFIPAAKSTAAYFSVANHSDKTRVLKKATISKIGRVEIHEHIHTEGMMRMQQVNELTLFAHKTINFQPGGYHLMAFDPAEHLKKGDKLTLTLYFANGEQLQSPIKVVSLRDEMSQQGHDHSQHKHH